MQDRQEDRSLKIDTEVTILCHLFDNDIYPQIFPKTTECQRRTDAQVLERLELILLIEIEDREFFVEPQQRLRWALELARFD